MKKFIATVFDGNSPLLFYLELMFCLVGTMNISIAFFGTVLPQQIAVQEIINFALVGIAFLAGAIAVFWIGTKTTSKKDVKNEWIVLTPLITTIFMGIFFGFIAIISTIQKMEQIFGKKAGQAIFFRLLTLISIYIISIAFVGLVVSLFLIKTYQKRKSKKKRVSKTIK